MKHSALLAAVIFGCATSLQAAARAAPKEKDEIRGEEFALLTSAPNVPPPITRRYSTKVILNLEVKEHTKQLADGVTYTYWTFGDDTPGKFIRVREGDLVQTKLSNHPDNTVAHNVDFHAATGPGGGGEASFVAPGHSATFTWRAMRPGLYLYHCVAAPAGLHIANGMYGLILIEPKEGMPKVDKEFFIVQGEFYTSGAYGERGPQQFDLKKALHEEPEYVVFNGRVGALMGEGALRVNIGESVRVYLGNAGPALVSSFHIVGEIFDNVYAEGGTQVNQHNVQTTVVPVGGSAMVEFSADVPGSYQLVDHSMFRAFNRGAMGALEVAGLPQPQLFTGRQAEGIFNPGTHLERLVFTPAPAAATPVRASLVKPTSTAKSHRGKSGKTAKNKTNTTNTKKVAVVTPTANAATERGRQVYGRICTTCHQPDGRGMPGVFPPLAQSDFLAKSVDGAIRVLLEGKQGPITVNGQTYNGVMPDFSLSNDDIAAVLTFVRSNFGNTGAPVTVSSVQQVRTVLADARKRDSQRVASDTPVGSPIEE